VIARRCERLRKLILEELEPRDYGAAAFLEVIRDPEKDAIEAAIKPITLIIRSSPLVLAKDNWLNDNMVLLD
jgi:hypothetical protein